MIMPSFIPVQLCPPDLNGTFGIRGARFGLAQSTLVIPTVGIITLSPSVDLSIGIFDSPQTGSFLCPLPLLPRHS